LTAPKHTATGGNCDVNCAGNLSDKRDGHSDCDYHVRNPDQTEGSQKDSPMNRHTKTKQICALISLLKYRSKQPPGICYMDEGEMTPPLITERLRSRHGVVPQP
jgi:hypothetical protein